MRDRVDRQHLSKWIKFFLNAVIKTSAASKKKMEQLLKIKEKSENSILRLGKQAIRARCILEKLYDNPIICLEQVEELLQITKPSASRLIKKMIDIGILTGLPNGKRNNFWFFHKYISVFKE